MTLNHLEALDEALVRPGRVDKKVHFANAGQFELCDLFMITYVFDTNEGIDNTSALYNNRIHSCTVNKKIHKLAQRFSNIILPRDITVAEVQAFLFHHKNDSHDELTYATTWSEQKIEERSNSAVEEFVEDQKRGRKKNCLENESDHESVSSTGDRRLAGAGEKKRRLKRFADLQLKSL